MPLLRPVALSIALLAAAALALPAGAAAHRTAPCIPGKPGAWCDVWTGKVKAVDDGDTYDVDVKGDGRRGPVRIRLTGVNAMEQSVYTSIRRRRRGACHALEATARVERLVREGHGRVRLAAQNPASHSGPRLRRSVAVRIKGRWRDVGKVLVSEGLALWLPNPTENAWNRSYSTLAERAASEHVGLWNTRYCGPGPDEQARLRVWVNWDADGNDNLDLDGEWVTIKNDDPLADVPLRGWWLRDSALRFFHFPYWAVVPAGGTLTVHVGSGESAGTDLYWGLHQPAFENVTRDGRAMGDGAYLFDPDGDLRAWMIYPCRYGCADPNQGAVEVAAHARGQEYVTIRNVRGSPVDLEGYRLQTPEHGYAFGADSVLDPGEIMRVDVGGTPDEDTRLDKHWERDEPILRDRGDTVSVSSYSDVSLACYAWGAAAC